MEESPTHVSTGWDPAASMEISLGTVTYRELESRMEKLILWFCDMAVMVVGHIRLVLEQGNREWTNKKQKLMLFVCKGGCNISI